MSFTEILESLHVGRSENLRKLTMMARRNPSACRDSMRHLSILNLISQCDAPVKKKQKYCHGIRAYTEWQIDDEDAELVSSGASNAQIRHLSPRRCLDGNACGNSQEEPPATDRTRHPSHYGIQGN